MSAPIGNTCPDIDKCLKLVNEIRSDAKGYRKYTEDKDFKDFADQVEDGMFDISHRLEDLRSDNDALRRWGKQMEEEAECLQVQYDELLEKFTFLENNLLPQECSDEESKAA